MSEWKRVSRREPCPVCGKPDYCTRTVDASAVRCMRVDSDKPSTAKDGTMGWIHALSNPLPPVSPTKTVLKKPDWTRECRAMFDHEKAHDKRCAIADTLAVSVESLELMRVGIGRVERRRVFKLAESRPQRQVHRLRSQVRRWCQAYQRGRFHWRILHLGVVQPSWSALGR